MAQLNVGRVAPIGFGADTLFKFPPGAIATRQCAGIPVPVSNSATLPTFEATTLVLQLSTTHAGTKPVGIADRRLGSG